MHAYHLLENQLHFQLSLVALELKSMKGCVSISFNPLVKGGGGGGEGGSSQQHKGFSSITFDSISYENEILASPSWHQNW